MRPSIGIAILSGSVSQIINGERPMSLKLAICIPTYNRGEFIGELLQSIAEQLTDEVEVIVSDNASDDNTARVVAEFRDEIPRLIYFRWERNMGADRNFLKSIELASAEYCWLMGSDDALEPSAIECVSSKLDSVPGLSGLSLNCRAYSKDLMSRIPVRPVTGGRLVRDTLFEQTEDGFCALGDYFGYLSGQVVDRHLWRKVVKSFDVSKYLNAYVHIYVIGNMLQINPKWLYVAQPCVKWRSDNDSFLSDGRFKRLAIDVVGYEKITGDIFGRTSRTYSVVMQTIATVHVRYAVLGAKLHGAPLAYVLSALRLCVEYYWRYPKFWLITFPLIIAPIWLLRLARVAYRGTIKPTVTKRRLMQ